MTLEKYLKEQRIDLGMKQVDLAGLFGFACAQFVWNVEREKCRWPVKHFPLLSSALEVPLNKMVEMRVSDLREEIWDELEGNIGPS